MSDLRNRLGSRVRDWRTSRGWTQEALGERAGLSHKFIGEIERGVGNPSLDTLEQIATAFGLDAGELIRHDPPTPSYATLSPNDYAVVREARARLTSIDDILQRLGDTPTPRRGKTPRRTTPGKR